MAKPAVEPGQPPRTLLRLANPILRAVLASRVHRPLSKQFILLTVTGQSTGRSYVIPVGRHELDGGLVVCASGSWRHNLRGGAPVGVTIDGREHAAYAEFDEDPDQVAEVYRKVLESLGPGRARLLGLKLNVRRLPTVQELRPVIAGERAIVRVRLLGK